MPDRLLLLLLLHKWPALRGDEVLSAGYPAQASRTAGLPLLALCGALLCLSALLAEPFEDGYHHWLLAANLLQSGRLADPLFGMEDSWLPVYSVVSASLLAIGGTWNLGLLKLFSAACGLVTVVIVYRLAANHRQGLIAAALLALNPVFLFTSGSAVTEPLLTTLLTATAFAVVRKSYRLAGSLAVVACATSTKAWIWLLVIAAVAGPWREWRLPRPPLWIAPALAAILVLEITLGSASHSAARGIVEAASAAQRGSIPGDPVGRTGVLLASFGLAALPTLLLAPFDLISFFRATPPRAGSGLHGVLTIPAFVYLTAVVALVATGVYSGSHRYLYPALPALALAASAVLDRHRAHVAVIATASAMLSAIGFLPVFASFAASNAGLLAAGGTAGALPGALLTDSPAAAFASHKQPAEISGSAGLPGDRGDALAWLRQRGVEALVLENISYYRATQLFPDLANGISVVPFRQLAGPFDVSGGKTVHVYWLPRSGAGDELVPGISVDPSPAVGDGKASAVAHGMGLLAGRRPATGEGVGFGVPIVQYPDGWVYPGDSTTLDASDSTTGRWIRDYQLDLAGGDAAHAYAFTRVPARGEIEITYTAADGTIRINVTALHLDPGYSQVGLLNEQSAAFDDFADSTRTLAGAQFGPWQTVAGPWARLRSASHGVEWSAPTLPGATLFSGRESAPPQFDWAGLDYMFPAPFEGTDYTIKVLAAR